MDSHENNPAGLPADAVGGPSKGRAEDSERGIRRQRRRTVRVSLILVALMFVLIAVTNIYVMNLLQLSAKHQRDLIICLVIGSVAVAPFMVILGIRWARPSIQFGRILSSGRQPTPQESLDAITAIVHFPMKLCGLMVSTYLLAAAIVVILLYYHFHFSNWELFSIGIMAAMVAFNLSVVLYYAAKQLERPQLERAAGILFEDNRFEFRHTKLSLRNKLMVVFFMVVAYILVSSVLMGYAQVNRVQRAQLEENLLSIARQDSEQQKSTRGKSGIFVMEKSGELLTGENTNISPENIKYMMAAQTGGVIIDEKSHKMIAFNSMGKDGMITGAIGFWGMSAGAKKATWVLLLELIIATILLCVVSTYLVVNDIDLPLSRTVEYLKKVWRGEDVGSLNTYSDDEMGILVGQVMRTTRALKERTNRSENLLAAVRAAIAGLNETMREVRAAGEKQSAAVREQVAAVEEAFGASSEILATSKQISENARDAEGATEDNALACRTGRDTISESMSGFTRLSEYIRSNSAAIMEVGGHYEKVRGIVSVIQEIATQIDLLALNAQIEAAGAGVEGLRFTVVAEEVGRLAARTVEAVSEIKSLVNNVHSALQKLISEAAQGVELVESGSVLADNVGNTIIGIQKLAGRTSAFARGIVLVTRQQTTASEQMADTIRSIQDNAQLILQNTDLVQSSMHSQDDLAKKLSSLLLADGENPEKT